MAYTTTKVREVFTPQERKDWGVHKATRSITGWSNGRWRAAHDVGIHCTWKYYPSPGTVAYKYHRTEILRYNDDEIMINTGGWNTVTTKKHLNEFLPYGHIIQRNYQLYFIHYGITVPFDSQLRIPRQEGSFLNEHLPYGRINIHGWFKYEGISVKWDEITAKLGGLPKDPGILRLKLLYSKK